MSGSTKRARSESGYVVVMRLVLDGSVTDEVDAEAVAEAMFEPAFDTHEVIAGSWQLEPALAGDDDA